MLDKIENILAKLDTSKVPQKMDLPGFRLHPLKGDLRLLGRHRPHQLADYLAL